MTNKIPHRNFKKPKIMENLNVVLKTLSLLVLMAIASVATAQSDYFLKLDDIKGESNSHSSTSTLSNGQGTAPLAAAYLKLGDIKGEIRHSRPLNIQDYQWGKMNKNSYPTMMPPRQHDFLAPIKIRKTRDRLSEGLQKASRTGILLPDVLTIVRTKTPKGEEYVAIRLKNVSVKNYQTTSGTTSDSLPVESFSLNYTEVEWTYFTPDGKPQRVIRKR